MLVRLKMLRKILIIYFDRWSPAEEFSKWVAFTYIGGTMGAILAYPLYGLILARIGWEVK